MLIAAFLIGFMLGIIVVTGSEHTVVVNEDTSTNKKVTRYKKQLYSLEELK
jgi:hypothetical protein